MHRTNGADTTTSKPTLSGSLANNTYHQNGPPGTIVDAYWANAVQEELAAVVEEFGTLDATGDVHTQVRDALYGAYSVQADATDTGVVSTDVTRAVIASTSSQSDGVTSAVVASAGCVATGARAAIIASFEAEVQNGSSYGAIIASSSSAEAYLYVSGDRSAIISSQGSATTSQYIASFGDSCAIIAGDGAPNIMATSAATSSCVIMATQGSVINDATCCAIIASGYDTGGSTADRPDIYSGSAYSVFMGCDGDASITSSNTIALASSFGTTGVTINEANKVVLYNGTTKNITLNASNGAILCQAIDVNDGVALGGGATATMGTIGGSGPTTAAQNQWLQASINGTTVWIPVWT
jgi:hypothetical protein